MWLLGIGMGFLPQDNITVKISKSPPGRYLLYRYSAMYKIYVPSYFTTPYFYRYDFTPSKHSPNKSILKVKFELSRCSRHIHFYRCTSISFFCEAWLNSQLSITVHPLKQAARKLYVPLLSSGRYSKS